MPSALYYRSQAARARRLAEQVQDEQIAGRLKETAQDYDDIAEDLESGATEIRHPELFRRND